MEYSKFKLKHDYFSYEKGDIILPNSEGNYIIETLGSKKIELSYDEILSESSIFEEIVEKDLDLKISEVSDDSLNKIKNWRIQLDVKTSQKKLKLIEKILTKEINKIL